MSSFARGALAPKSVAAASPAVAAAARWRESEPVLVKLPPRRLPADPCPGGPSLARPSRVLNLPEPTRGGGRSVGRSGNLRESVRSRRPGRFMTIDHHTALEETVFLALSDFAGAQVLRPLIGRMRPCFALPPASVRWLAAASDVGSLPSLHASNFFAMAVVARARSRAAGAVAFVIAAAVALSRVVVGVHWPTDVLAGAAWGALCGVAGLAVARRLVGLHGRRGRAS